MYRNPVGLAITGVILIIVAMVVRVYLPVLESVATFVIGVGWVMIGVAILLFVVEQLRGVNR